MLAQVAFVQDCGCQLKEGTGTLRLIRTIPRETGGPPQVRTEFLSAGGTASAGGWLRQGVRLLPSSALQRLAGATAVATVLWLGFLWATAELTVR